MAERTLNDPLSGDEIKEIILMEIEKRLNGDCTLMGGLAYAGFTASFEIKIRYLRSLTAPTMVWGTGEAKPPEGVEVAATPETTSITDDYTTAIPNTARQEHDLPIPVLVQTPTGLQRRRVRIEKA